MGELEGKVDVRAGEGKLVTTPAYMLGTRISEVAEHDAPQILRLLEAAGIVPGRRVEVSDAGTGLGALTLRLDDDVVPLGLDVAQLVWAEPEPG